MKRIPRITRSGDFSAVWNGMIAPLLDENFREARVQPGIGCQVSSSPGGQSILVNRQITPTASPRPWDLSLVTNSDGIAVSIWPGVVSGIMPTNMFSPFSLDATQQWYVVATATTDGVRVTSVEIKVTTDVPNPQTPGVNALPGSVDVLVGIVNASLTYNMTGGRNPVLTPQILNSAAGGFTGVWQISY